MGQQADHEKGDILISNVYYIFMFLLDQQCVQFIVVNYFFDLHNPYSNFVIYTFHYKKYT